jgi:hypothetical protein
MEVYTTGFTKKTAAQFFGSLRQAGIKRLVDVRLNNSSQLAGFTKKGDLAFFLKEVCGIEYLHEPLLAPMQDMLNTYKKQKGSWSDYEQGFLALMRERRVEERIDPRLFGIPTVLLCSLSVTDIRLYEADHQTPKENLIKQINRRMQDGNPVILSLGLTRPFRPDDDTVEQHWLQLNNIHLKP